MRCTPAILAGLVLLSGCASRPAVTLTPVAPITAESSSLFDQHTLDAASSILNGFDLGPDSTPDWTPGDSILLGLSIQSKDSRIVRLLKVEAGDSRFSPGSYNVTLAFAKTRKITISSFLFPTTITLYDENGKQLSQSRGEFPSDCVTRGVYLCELASIERRESGLPMPIPPDEFLAIPDEQVNEMGRRQIWILAIAPSMGKNPALSRLLRPIVNTPSIFSYLFGANVSISNVGLPQRDTPLALADRAFPSISTAMRLAINSKPALEGTLRAVPIVAPIYLCGGVTAVDANNPAEPDRRVHIRLLAAKRGKHQ